MQELVVVSMIVPDLFSSLVVSFSVTKLFLLIQGIITLFQTEFSHTESDPLGKRWRNHEKRRLNDWKDAAKVCPEWTEDHLEKLLEKQ